jgi:ADP-ribosylglycohydrolase
VCTAATEQVDGVSSATARTDLLALAILNGLNHGPFRLAMDSVLPEEETYRDGSYTAQCKEEGSLLFQAHFALKDDKFAVFEVREAADEWADAAEEYAAFLLGQGVSALDRLPSAFAGEEKAYQFCAAVWESLAK